MPQYTKRKHLNHFDQKIDSVIISQLTTNVQTGIEPDNDYCMCLHPTSNTIRPHDLHGHTMFNCVLKLLEVFSMECINMIKLFT